MGRAVGRGEKWKVSEVELKPRGEPALEALGQRFLGRRTGVCEKTVASERGGQVMGMSDVGDGGGYSPPNAGRIVGELDSSTLLGHRPRPRLKQTRRNHALALDLLSEYTLINQQKQDSSYTIYCLAFAMLGFCGSHALSDSTGGDVVSGRHATRQTGGRQPVGSRGPRPSSKRSSVRRDPTPYVQVRQAG